MSLAPTDVPWRQFRVALLLALVTIIFLGTVGMGGAQASVTAELHEIGEQGEDEGELSVGVTDEIWVNYTAEDPDGAIEEVTLLFEDVHTGQIEQETVLPDEGTLNETVSVPEEGLYNISLEVDGDDPGDEDEYEWTPDVDHGFLKVFTETPSVSIDDPLDDSLTSVDNVIIEGTAFDGLGIQNVTLEIERTNEDTDETQYWNASEGDFVDDEGNKELANITDDIESIPGISESWEYEALDEFIDGETDSYEYVVTANTYDAEGNNIGAPGVPDTPGGDVGDVREIEFILIENAPQIDDTLLKVNDNEVTGDEEVQDGDELTFNVTVDQSGITGDVEIWVESSELGFEDDEAIGLDNTVQNNSTYWYEGTLTGLEDPPGEEGPVTIEAFVEYDDENAEEIGLSDSDEFNSVNLIKLPANVPADSVTFEADFLGVEYDDANEPIDVWVSGVEDDQGNDVDGEIDFVIDGETIEYEIEISDGSGAFNIDPDEDLDMIALEEVGDTEGTFHVNDTGDEIGDITVNTVHEAYELTSGIWQPLGTPTHADEIEIDAAEGQVYHYDAELEEDEQWTEITGGLGPITEAGSSFYVNVDDPNTPRIGYNFDTDIDEGEEIEQPWVGGEWNLVGSSALPGEERELEEDLFEGIEADTERWERAIAGEDIRIDTDDNAGELTWDTEDLETDQTTDGYEAYWVDVPEDAENMDRYFEVQEYDGR